MTDNQINQNSNHITGIQSNSKLIVNNSSSNFLQVCCSYNQKKRLCWLLQGSFSLNCITLICQIHCWCILWSPPTGRPVSISHWLCQQLFSNSAPFQIVPFFIPFTDKLFKSTRKNPRSIDCLYFIIYFREKIILPYNTSFCSSQTLYRIINLYWTPRDESTNNTITKAERNCHH